MLPAGGAVFAKRPIRLRQVIVTRWLKPMDLRLWSDLLNRSVLFLGYSFRDPNVAYLFRQVKERFARLPNTSSGRRAYIVVQDPSQFERRLFQERNIEVIHIDGRGRTEAVAALLNDIRS